MTMQQMIKETTQSETETFECLLNASQKTEQQSLTFVKKLLTIGLSSITYLRNVLPEGAYINRNMEGLELKILNEHTNDSSGKLLVNYINASFEAIENKYLRTLTLNIEDSCVPDKKIETFTFSFSYPVNGEYIVDELKGENYSSRNGRNAFNVKKPTVKMLRTVILLSQALAPLPENIHLTMELQYYENVTPPKYEPRGFAPIMNSSRFNAETVNIQIGNVVTKYHAVYLKCKTTNLNPTENEKSVTDEELERCGETQETLNGGLESRQLDEDLLDLSPYSMELVSNRTWFEKKYLDYVRVPSEDMDFTGFIDTEVPKDTLLDKSVKTCVTPYAPENYFTLESVIKSLGEKDLLEDINIDINEGIAKTPHQPILSTPREGSAIIRTGSAGSAYSSSQNSEASDIHFLIRCPCGISFDQGIMILCDVCGYWQHGACFNIINEEQAPARHICEKCADPPSICTDPRLTCTNLPVVSAACMYRRTLVVLGELKDSTITPEVLIQYLGSNEALTSGLIMRTTREGITQKNEKSGSFSINKFKLMKEAFPKYLRTPEEHPTLHNVDDNISKNNITSIQQTDLGKMPSGRHENNVSHGIGSLQQTKRKNLDNKENMMPDSPQDMFNQGFSRKKPSYRSMSQKINI